MWMKNSVDPDQLASTILVGLCMLNRNLHCDDTNHISIKTFLSLCPLGNTLRVSNSFDPDQD